MSPVEELLNRMLRPLCILYVEDSKQIADCLRVGLKSRYVCTMDWVPTGELALEQLSSHTDPYDLILLDLVLPAMSGLEVLRYIKKNLKHTPVIIVTGYAGSDLALEAERCGVISILAKPFNLDDFDDIFKTFKMRVRSHEDERYFASRDATTLVEHSSMAS